LHTAHAALSRLCALPGIAMTLVQLPQRVAALMVGTGVCPTTPVVDALMPISANTKAVVLGRYISSSSFPHKSM
jgi:hypothetical protein